MPNPPRLARQLVSDPSRKGPLGSRAGTVTAGYPQEWLLLSRAEWEQIAVDVAQRMQVERVHDWQLETAIGLSKGQKRVILAGTGKGKSTVWVLLAAAIDFVIKREGTAEGVRRMVVLVSVTKAMHDDQVRQRSCEWMLRATQ